MEFIVIVKHVNGTSYWTGSSWGAKRFAKRYTLNEARKARDGAYVTQRHPNGTGVRAVAEVAPAD